jgi:3-hydroxyacyl-CoA dehydrogenase/enoyl-CoA hydratase/3-hydroxybutyryl-CoA epimerase
MLFDGLAPRHWKTELRPDGVLVLSLDRADAPVNALAQAVLDELELMIERIAIEPPKAVIVRSA